MWVWVRGESSDEVLLQPDMKDRDVTGRRATETNKRTNEKPKEKRRRVLVHPSTSRSSLVMEPDN